MGCNASNQAKTTVQTQPQNGPATTGQSNNNAAATSKQDNTIQPTSSSSSDAPKKGKIFHSRSDLVQSRQLVVLFKYLYCISRSKSIM